MHGPTREAVEAVEGDRDRGSEAISQDALEAVADHLVDASAGTAADLRESTRAACRAFAKARPEMRVVASKVAAAWRRVRATAPADADLPTLREEGAGAVRNLHAEAAEARADAAATAAEILEDGGPVATVSDSSTVRLALEDRSDPVHVLESRPGGEGRGFAAGLREDGLEARLAPDADAAGLLEREGVDAVVFGADGVTRSGDVINAVGSRTLATAAARQGVPVWVACSTWKCAPGPAPSEAADWDPAEAPGVDVPRFEAVPADLLDGVATERGPLRPREAGEVARRRAKDLANVGLDVGPP